jgi:hypothetical protein
MDLEVSLADSSSLNRSIFFGQQNTGRRTVGFGNHPKLFTRSSAIGAQEPKALLD